MDINILFDIVIALIMLVVPLYLIQLWYRWNSLTTRGPRVLAVVLLVVLWVVVGFGSFIEPRFLTVHEQVVTIGPGTKNLKVIVVGDLHLGRYRFADWTEQVVERVNTLQPDVVLLLGDNIDDLHGTADLFPLAKLKTHYGAYAVLGNTDYRVGAVEVRKAIENYHVEVLTNEWLKLGNSGVVLAGLDDLWYGWPDWERTFHGIPSGAPVILAVHNPDDVSRAEHYGADLMISGHTHGGQIRLPFIGPIGPMPTTLGRQYDRGLFPWGRTQMFITSGAGESSVRARLFDPPEIVQLDVRY